MSRLDKLEKEVSCLSNKVYDLSNNLNETVEALKSNKQVKLDLCLYNQLLSVYFNQYYFDSRTNNTRTSHHQKTGLASLMTKAVMFNLWK